MNIEELLRNMNPQMLSAALGKMSSILSPDQMKQVENAIKGSDKDELNQKLNNLSASDLQRELKNNPEVAGKLMNNPELMKKISEILKK